jgi:hypothetical protein
VSVEELLTWAGSAASACSGDAGFLLLGLIPDLYYSWVQEVEAEVGYLMRIDAVTSSLGLSTEWGLMLTFNFFNWRS